MADEVSRASIDADVYAWHEASLSVHGVTEDRGISKLPGKPYHKVQQLNLISSQVCSGDP